MFLFDANKKPTVYQQPQLPLEDHPMTSKSLATMVIVSPITGATFSFQMAFSCLIHGDDPNYLLPWEPATFIFRVITHILNWLVLNPHLVAHLLVI